MRPVASKVVGSNRITGEGNEVLNWKLWWISNFGTLQKKTERERDTAPQKEREYGENPIRNYNLFNKPRHTRTWKKPKQGGKSSDLFDFRFGFSNQTENKAKSFSPKARNGKEAPAGGSQTFTRETFAISSTTQCREQRKKKGRRKAYIISHGEFFASGASAAGIVSKWKSIFLLAEKTFPY